MTAVAADDTGPFLDPALLTGTSEEFLGKKPLPRVLRCRQVVYVLGPEGVGKSTVARSLCGQAHVELDTRQLEHVMLERVRLLRWPERIEQTPALVVDGPVWLRNRRGAVNLLLELARQRAVDARRTVFVQGDADGSLEELISHSEPGSAVVVGLRFPTGRRGRLRCARRLCAELGLPFAVAAGSEVLEPWRYDRLVAHLVERAFPENPPASRATHGDHGGTGG